MMKILGRYIAKIVVQATLMAALIIISISFILSLMAEAKSIGSGEYGFTQSIFYVLMRMPGEVYHFSPLLLLLGSIIGLSMLSTHRELAVMRTSGYSIRQIITSVLLAAFMMIVIISLMGEWLAPALNHKAVIQKENAQHGSEAVATASGTWLHIDNNFIHLQNAVNRHHVNGVTRYQFDNERKLEAVYYAQSMVLEDNQWMLKNVVKTSFYPMRTKSQFMAELPWDLKFNARFLNASVLEPNELSLPALVRFARNLEKNGLQSSEYRFNFWQRIFQPIASLVMIFLAIPFVLGALSQASMGLRIVLGILAGFTFFILNELLGQMSIVYQLSPFFAALLPIVVFVFVGMFLSRRLIRT